MTQLVTIDRTTLEQLIHGVEMGFDFDDGDVFGVRSNDMTDALAEGYAALANAEPTKISLTNTSTGSLPQRVESIFEAMDKEVAAGRLVRSGPMEWRKL